MTVTRNNTKLPALEHFAAGVSGYNTDTYSIRGRNHKRKYADILATMEDPSEEDVGVSVVECGLYDITDRDVYRERRQILGSRFVIVARRAMSPACMHGET